ncbi:tetratricopeptide repeat protein [Streptomyces sp. NBC_00019]|uniref:tetratricopeptide repeat protein n=1 Tax=Streptomyces sp. NBC_00019 TaxID=2975623 RepID=UPI002F915C3C
MEHGLRSLAIARTLGRPYEIARSIAIVGWFHAVLGDHQEALAWCEEALPLLAATGNRHDVAGVRGNIGYIRQRLGDVASAIEDYRQSLRLYEELLDEYKQAELLNDLASAQLELGDAEQTRANWNRSADLFDALRVARAAEMRAKAESLPQPKSRLAD